MNTRLVFIAVCAAGVVWRGPGIAHAGQIKFPCVGETNTDRVNLRSGRSLNYEIVAQLDRGKRVTVCGLDSGWFRVIPPKDVSFWVSSSHISGGKVIPGRLNVRVRPSTNSTVICQLSRDERVDAIEARDEWTSIKPPSAACLWVSSELIDLLPDEKGIEKPEGLSVEGDGAGEDTEDVEGEETPVASEAARVEETTVEGQPGTPPAARLQTVKVPRVYEGTMERCEEVTVSGADHSIVAGFFRKRVLCLLKSGAINLSYYEGDRVKVWGYEVGRSPDGTPVLDVRRLEVE